MISSKRPSTLGSHLPPFKQWLHLWLPMAIISSDRVSAECPCHLRWSTDSSKSPDTELSSKSRGRPQLRKPLLQSSLLVVTVFLFALLFAFLFVLAMICGKTPSKRAMLYIASRGQTDVSEARNSLFPSVSSIPAFTAALSANSIEMKGVIDTDEDKLFISIPDEYQMKEYKVGELKCPLLRCLRRSDANTGPKRAFRRSIGSQGLSELDSEIVSSRRVVSPSLLLTVNEDDELILVPQNYLPPSRTGKVCVAVQTDVCVPPHSHEVAPNRGPLRQARSPLSISESQTILLEMAASVGALEAPSYPFGLPPYNDAVIQLQNGVGYQQCL